jgi:hypothetical protein
MPLHIVIPGLLWPKDSAREASRDLPLPGLEGLLGRGRPAWQPPLPLEHWLCRHFGVAAEAPACGALRLWGEGGAPGHDCWICADPLHLRFARDTLILGSPGELDLTGGESSQLVAALNEHLAEFGEFVGAHPRRWYLRLKRLPRIVTQPLSAVVGRQMEAVMPQGEEAKAWRSLINEAQVLLHNHPANIAREAAGRRTANSLWFWGAGALPAAAPAPAATLLSDNPLALGLAKLAGAHAQPLPKDAGALAATEDSLLLIEDLAEAAHTLDIDGWRAALTKLEHDWFAPLLAALTSRRMQTLRLTALGDDGLIDGAIRASDLWKLWRRPQPLHRLAP